MVCHKSQAVDYDQAKGIINITRPGIYRMIGTAFIIDKCRENNYPNLAFYCTNAKCIMGNCPVMTRGGMYNHFSMGAETIFRVDEKHYEFALLNTNSYELYLAGAVYIEQIK